MNNDDFILFTPGPVQMSKSVLEVGSRQLPYFRTDSFSRQVQFCEQNLLQMVNAPEGSRCIFLASSGTGAMDAVMTNLFNESNNILIVNGGEFGKRFTELASFYNIKFNEILKNQGETVSHKDLLISIKPDTNAFLINGLETSTGVLYDLHLTGKFCSDNNLLNIVDGISVFLNDELDMINQYIDVLILSSQKGLALPPGLSIIILSPAAIEKVKGIRPRSYYFDFQKYLDNMIRFQTPFTPPIGIILQLKKRLEDIVAGGGPGNEIIRKNRLANYFRSGIKEFPLRIFSERLSNGITALCPTDDKSAINIVRYFEANYKVYLCPNGGKLSNKVFRVSHMGDINEDSIDRLINSMKKYYEL